ncbi:MAG: tryptophan-rich sensory protein [Gammaproteobacteria bacterium]|nr:tryptophan-rich sensory protein [Gammaproteobacteria bacterium]
MIKASSSNNLRGLIRWLVLAFVAAAIGGLGSANAPDFYGQLTLPDWAPPAWLFGPVWSVLYLMMGIASWLVWRRGGFSRARPALVIYIVQLGLNTLWSWLFFAWQSGLLAFVEILLLWMLIVATLIAFYRISRPAALLLLPYLLWVSFAAALAWNSWQMNPVLLG